MRVSVLLLAAFAVPITLLAEDHIYWPVREAFPGLFKSIDFMRPLEFGVMALVMISFAIGLAYRPGQHSRPDASTEPAA